MDDGLQWIRDIIPTHYYDNKGEIDDIMNKTLYELGVPMFHINLSEEETTRLWNESNNIIKEYTDNIHESTVIKHWRIRYTIELCKELVCVYGRYDNITGNIAPNIMVLLERTLIEKRQLRNELKYYYEQ